MVLFLFLLAIGTLHGNRGYLSIGKMIVGVHETVTHDLEYVRRYSFKENPNTSTIEGQEEEECGLETCPNCHTPMKFYKDIPPTASLDLTYIGFANGPPKHKEVFLIA